MEPMEANDWDLVNVLWWVNLARGLAAVAFGTVAIFWPGLTLLALVYLFSAYVLVSGILNVIYGVFSVGRGSFWLLTLLLGIAEIGVGIYAVRNPLISFVGLILLIGFMFIFRGVIEIVTAFMGRTPDNANRALLVLGGALAIAAGAIILLYPATGGVAFVWALGVYAMVTGALLIARAVAARSLIEQVLAAV